MNCDMQPLQFHAKNTFIIDIRFEDYEFKQGDKLYFTAKPKADNDKTDSSAVIKASWTFGTDANLNDDGDLELKLSAEQTDVDFGDYFYDIKHVNDGASETIIAGKLRILPVATLEF